MIPLRTLSGWIGIGAPSSGGSSPVATSSPSSDVTLSPSSAPIQIMRPSAAINVRLPAAEDAPGTSYLIQNISDETIVVREDGGDPVVAVYPGMAWEVTSTGDSAVSGGWVVEGMAQVRSVSAATLSGDLVLDDTSALLQSLDPDDSSRNVDLPDLSTVPGRAYEVTNTGDGSQVVVVRSSAGDGNATLAELRPGETGFFYASSSWSLLFPIVRKGVESHNIPAGATETMDDGSGLVQVLSNTGPNGSGDANLRVPVAAGNQGRPALVRFTSLGGAAGTEGLSVQANDGSAIGGGITLPDASGTATPSSLLLVSDGTDWTSMGAFAPIANSI